MDDPPLKPAAQNGDQPTGLRKISLAVDSGLRDFFEKEARFIAARPWKVIIVCFLVTFVCACGLLRFDIELDQEELYTPQDAQAFKDRDRVEELFGNQGFVVQMYVLPTGQQGSALTREVVLGTFDIYDIILSMDSTYDGVTRKFQDQRICRRPAGESGPCEIYSILDFWGYDRELFNRDVSTDADVVAAVNRANPVDRFGMPLEISQILGGIERDASGGIVSANATQARVFVKAEFFEVGGDRDDHITAKWQVDLDKAVRQEYGAASPLDVHLNSDSVFSVEADKAISSDVFLLSIGYFLIITYGHVVLSKPGMVHSRSWLTVTCVGSVGLSILCSFGLASAMGFKFNLVVQVLTFLLLGLGLDDAFVIIGMLDHTDPALSHEERVVQAMARAGPSITVTSVTDFVAFCVGTATALPALQWFCVYAAIGILFDFIFQVTFFVAFLFIDGRRVEQQRIDYLCCVKAADPDKAWCCFTSPADPNAVGPVRRFMGGAYQRALLSTPGKAGVVLVSLGLFAMGIYGCTEVYMDFQYQRWFVSDDSYLHDTFDVADTYFRGFVIPFSAYTLNPGGAVDYFDKQDELLALGEGIRTDPYVSPTPPMTYWYTDFSEWLRTGPHASELVDGGPPDSARFHSWLREFVDGPGFFYSSSIKWTDEARTAINATKLTAYTVAFTSGERAVDTLDSIRGSVEGAAPTLEAFAFTYPFLFWEGFKVITWETLRNVIVAGSAVFLVCVVLLADVKAALMVMLMIALVDVELLGYMHYVDLQFNTVTCINLVLALGLSVDYSAHIAHSFMSTTGTGNERAAKALEEIGASVVSGAFTTFLAVAMMGGASQYIFRTFFKMFIAIITLGVFNGCALLPVIMSAFGPQPYPHSVASISDRQTSQKESKEAEKLAVGV